MVLVAQHDPIVLAKQVATLDHLSGGRVVLGIGFGWNRQEAADHGVAFGTRRRVAREHVLCMQALWSEDEAEYHGDHVDLDPCWSWPKPVQQPGVTIMVGGGAYPSVFAAVAEYADGWLPIGGAGLADALPVLRRAVEDAGRDPDRIRVVPFGTVPNDEKLDHYRSLGSRRGRAPGPVGKRRRDAGRPRPTRRLPPAIRRRRWLTGPSRSAEVGKPWSGGGRDELADAVRRLIALTVTAAAPPEALADAARRAEALADELEGHVPPPGAGPTARFAEHSVGADEVDTLASAMPFDVIIGSCNPLALPIAIEFEPPKAIGRAVFTAPYEGAPGCVHGAAIAGAFDIMLTAANVIAEGAGPTVELSLRFLKPTLVGRARPVRGVGHLARRPQDPQPGPARPTRGGDRRGGRRIRQHGAVADHPPCTGGPVPGTPGDRSRGAEQ